MPIDTEYLGRLRQQWPAIKGRLVGRIDAEYGVYVPAGQRKIDPQSRLGEALLRTAAEWEIDAHELAEAVYYLWARQREADAEHLAALATARKTTGLTAKRIVAWERQGRQDYASYPGLDDQRTP